MWHEACVGGVNPSETGMETVKGMNGIVPNPQKKFQQNFRHERREWVITCLLGTVSWPIARGTSGGAAQKHTVNIRTSHSMQESCQVKAY